MLAPCINDQLYGISGNNNLSQLLLAHPKRNLLNFASLLSGESFVAKPRVATNTQPVQQLPLRDEKEPRRFNDGKWAIQLRQLLNFRQTFGHCLVPHTFPPNPFLARWVKRQRRQYKLMMEGKHSTMTPERVRILNNTGFVWDSHEAIWKFRLHQLHQFKKIHGHCLVPSGYPAEPQLATWVKCQRRQYKLYSKDQSSGITAERIMTLNEIGFEWEIRSCRERN
mmetsp:Transcript_28969/g.44519  ORF Transcript_28969/g.44519 Transcript_28969/m.44519 type:complete len:224 (+) Transcript_28969:50-721(+)|eukprot:CAMPEP_0118701446 /NCGR_PEP_ID=MMETSP0800-20121206/17259_1 /TAXON_ID=210618 ORGANISM="Striatella unipunctata, Strain CCMP2910" /NCGR_SAMPLE_ID=MMETSP0800 /ASSEMBLY_ACC=CAM_ASM_000638 /LENGTH=223 /DNA_ID=CAMNT_0006602375 /DNA_START=1 /DNA_END=672 /DNA_ORIENTATION=-